MSRWDQRDLSFSLSPWERVGVRDEVSEYQLLVFFFFLEQAQATSTASYLIAERLTEGREEE
jgi:hypothetical protein